MTGAAAPGPPPPPFLGPPPPPVFVAPGGGGVAVPGPLPRPLPPPTAETLAIPLGPRRLVGVSLDLLTRRDSGLRAASFYIGLIALVTAAPAVALLGLAISLGEFGLLEGPGRLSPLATPPAWTLWLLLAALPAVLGLMAVGVEAKALATTVIGGWAEGRPLRMREAIAVTRSTFWAMLRAGILVGLLSMAVQWAALAALGGSVHGDAALSALDYAVAVAVGVVVGTPFVYAPAAIVLGEVGAITALRRSVGLALSRKRLAVVVATFAVLAGLVVQLGVGLAADTVLRLADGAGLEDGFPPALAVPLAAALVFAYGTLVLLTEAIAAAPAVHAFVGLTRYTGGLERGRRDPARVRRLWDPWFTPGLAAGAALAALALVLGVLSLPWPA